MADGDGALERLATGFRERTLKSAKLTLKIGLKALGKTLRPNTRGKPVDAERALSLANALVAELDGLKGLMMKFGQMASYLNATLPPEAQAALARLQAQSSGMAWDSVAEVLRQSFDAEPDALFTQIDRCAFAAASIGQVHRARLGDRRLAVKIQYPGIVAAIESDLATLGRLGRMAMFFGPLPGKQLLRELAERTLDECDYEREGRNQQLFGELLASVPGAYVPAVCRERSTARVLSSEYIEGLDFQRFSESASQQEKNRAGQTIFTSSFQTIFGHATFNGDPHPGNYLFREGQVVFIDFGCVRFYTADFVERWRRLAYSILDDDRAIFPEALTACGLVKTPRGFDWDHQWDLMNYLYRPYKSARPFTYTSEYVRESYDTLLWQNRNMFKATITPEWLYLNRLQWGLNSVLAQLNATADWGTLIRQLLATPLTPAVPT